MSEVMELAPIRRQEIESDGAAIVRRAQELTIIDADSYALAVDVTRDAKGRIAAVKEAMDPIVQSAHETHRRLTKMRGDLCAPFESAINLANNKRQAYDAEQERRRRAEEDRLRREAEEAARRQREAEIAEAKRKAAELAEQARIAKERADAETAKRLEAEAKLARAETRELKAAPVEYIPPPVVADTRPKVEGSARRVTYKAEIADMFRFVQWCAADQSRVQYLIANAQPLNTFARNWGKESDGSPTSVMPGIRIKQETSYATKGF